MSTNFRQLSVAKEENRPVGRLSVLFSQNYA